MAASVGIGLMANPVHSYASTKIFTLNIQETCYNAEFNIECPNDKQHTFSYTLQSPDGAMYTVTWDEDNELKQFLEQATAGSWTVMVSDNQDNSDADDSIGKVKVSVKKNVERSSETTDASTDIAKEISGLRIYFKDSSIVVSWEDEAVGNVNVQVINAKTLEKYYNDTVKTKSVEVPLPADATDLTITVVPSTSTSVPGATQSYTYKIPDWFVNNSTDSITFPEYSNTNSVELPFHVETGSSYALEYYINGQRVGGEETMPAGSYDLSLPISEGTNEIQIYLVDGKGNMKSWSDRIVLDTKAPSLTVEGLQDGLTTYDESIVVSGQADDYDQVLYNNQQIDVDFDGAFSIEIPLSEGTNKVQIAAIDVAGNRTEKTATITRLVKEEKTSSDSNILVLGLASIAGLATVVILKKKQKSKTPPPPVSGKISKKQGKNAEESSEKPKKKSANTRVEEGSRKKSSNKAENMIRTSKAYTAKSAEAIKAPAKKKSDAEVNVRNILSVVLIPLAISFFLTRVVFSASIVQSGSMEPTIMTYDVVIANSLAYKVRTPQRGDIVYIQNEMTDNELFVKRVIGLPGETVSFKDGYVYIDGQKLNEAYIGEDVETNSTKTYEVPDGCYFVLGDNRENSLDSRYWDDPYVKFEDIKGKILVNFPSFR